MMRQSKIAMVVLLSGALSGVGAAGSPKTVDCLQVSVVPQSADPERAANPMQPRPGIRPLHMILTNVCSVNVTAFTLDLNVTSPIPQKRHPGVDMLGRLAQPGGGKIPRTGTEFPFDWNIAGEPEEDSRPLELTVKVSGLVFRDGTAAGDASWVADVQEARKKTVQEFTAELALLAQIAHLEKAKAVLSGDPDPSLKGAVRAFWLQCKRSLPDDPAKWTEYIDQRAYELQALTKVFSEHTELTMDSK